MCSFARSGARVFFSSPVWLSISIQRMDENKLTANS